MQRLLAAVGTLVLSAGLIVAVPAVASAQEPIGRIAVCEHRVCLLVLDESSDSDGDGVADVDEDTLGSDALDPDSYPDVVDMLDLVLERQLPSFEEHLTELVVLPRNTPDGKLATPFGALDIPEQGSSVLESVEDLFDQVEANGFDNLGLGVTAWLTDSELSEAQWLPLAIRGGVAIGLDHDSDAGIGNVYGPHSFGVNSDQDPSEFSDAGFSYGDGGVLQHEYSVGYEDGGWDDVNVTSSVGEDSTVTTSMNVVSYGKWDEKTWQNGATTASSKTRTWATSDGLTMGIEGSMTTVGYDEDGKVIESAKSDYRSWTGTMSDGYTYKENYTSTTNYDADGNKTNETTTSFIIETSPDGTTKSQFKSETTKYNPDGSVAEKEKTETVDDGKTTTTKTTKTTYDEDGNEKSETETETCNNETNECTVTTGDGETDIPNPVAVELGPITAADLARVAARLNSLRTPSKDDYGEIGDLPPGGVVQPGVYNPMVALVNPDGVSTFAAGGPPQFNGASPDYAPDLADVIETSGVGPPGIDPVSWPGD